MTSVGGSVQAAPVGEGFTVSAADLSYILEQIKIAEAHVVNTTSQTGPCGSTGWERPQSDPQPFPVVRSPHRGRFVQQPGARAGDVRRCRPDLPSPDHAGVPQRRADHGRTARRAARAHLVRPDQRIGDRLRAAHDQQPDRRPDLDQPGGDCCCRLSRSNPRRHRCRAVHDRPDAGAIPTARPTIACPATRRCSSPTSRPTSDCRRPTTRCSRSSVSSSITASTRSPTAGPARCSSR